MKITTFGAIYIGSYEVSLKIFELTARNPIREIDYVRARVEIGKDTYQKGYIGYELLEELGNVLYEYKKIMDGYKVDAYEAYAGGVFSDVKNELFVLEQLYIRSGIRVKVLSNSERRFIGYKAMAFHSSFEDIARQGAAVVDVGGDSLQITLFSEGKVITTQHLVLGTMRLKEQLSEISNSVAHGEKQIEELINKDLEFFKTLHIKNRRIKTIIFMGDYITELTKRKIVSSEKFIKSMHKFYKKNVEQITAELNITNERDPLLMPYIVLYTRLAEELNAEDIWAPGASVSDGIAWDYALKKGIVKPAHDFECDILSAAKHIAKRYKSFSPHVELVRDVSVQIFDTMKKQHGMQKRERLLLQVAAILHSCGRYISLARGAECSYEIIKESEIIGLSREEREIVAFAVLYNGLPMAEYEEVADRLDKTAYMKVAKLAAILQVADAVDRSHKQKIRSLTMNIKERRLTMTAEALEDIILEKSQLDERAVYFERVFGIKPVLREKRTY